jgi:small subunit ribosomal protein S5
VSEESEKKEEEVKASPEAAKESAENKPADVAPAGNEQAEKKAPAAGGQRRDNKRRTRRDRKPRRRDDRNEQRDEFMDTLVPGGIFKCTAVVKGGRRLSFGALVVVGNRKGKVGIGYGKAKEVPMAIQKAIKEGRKEVKGFPLVGDGTIPHEVHGRYGAAHVVLVPAGPGTGVIAGSTVKTVLEMGGVHNVLTKSFGSNNRKNLVKATMRALASLRSKESVETLRGVSVS